MNVKKAGFLLVMGVVSLVSCVDKAYDLSDVDTDGMGVGDKWVVPLGRGRIPVGDLIDVEANPEIVTDEKGNYTARVYPDNPLRVDMREYLPYLPGGRASAPGVDFSRPIVSDEIDLREVVKVFDEQGLVLSFEDPHILMSTSGNIVASDPVETHLDLTAEKNGAVQATRVDLDFRSVTGNYWVGPTDKNVTPEYEFIGNEDLGDLIKVVPEALRMELYLDRLPSSIESVPDYPYIQLDYMLEIPFVPAPDFSAVLRQSIDDVFSGEIVDYLFSSGTAEIFGTVSNGLPFRLSMVLDIVDEEGNSLGIRMPAQQIASCGGGGQAVSSEVSFLVTEEDMPKIAAAKSIAIQLHAMGSQTAAGVSLNSGQVLELELKIRKTGGITVE